MSCGSKNRFSNYYKAACSSCYSNTDPFDTNRSYLSDLPFTNNMISGASEYASRNYTVGGDIYGAQFQEAKESTNNIANNRETRPYEYIIKEKITPPWLGNGCENTFMNVIKERNQAPVKTYKQLILSPIPTQKTASVVEGFRRMSNNRNVMLLSIIIIMLILCSRNR